MRLTMYLLALGAFLTGTAELVVGGIIDRIAEDLQVSVALAGQLITAYSVAFAIGTPFLIALTARIPRKKVMILALACFIAGCLASYLSSDYMVVMISRVVVGSSAGVYLVVAISSIAKLVPPEQTGRAIGMIAFGFGGAMALGVPIGIAISGWWHWQMIFALLGGVSLLVMLGLLRLLPEIEGDAPVTLRQQLAILRNPVIAAGLLISFFLCMSNSILLTYLTPFLQNVLHLNTSGLGMMMLVLGLTGMLGSRLGGTAVDKWGAVRMITVTLLMSCLSLTFLPLLIVPVFLGLALITIWMCSMFMNGPALQLYFIQQAPLSSNLVLSVNTSVIHLGIALGAGLGGAAVSSAQTVLYHPWLAAGIGALSFIAALVSIGISKRKHTGLQNPSTS